MGNSEHHVINQGKDMRCLLLQPTADRNCYDFFVKTSRQRKTSFKCFKQAGI